MSKSPSNETGFFTYSSARVRSFLCCSKISSAFASLDRITIGISARAGSFLIFLQTKNPFIPSSSMASRISVGGVASACAMPALPSATTVTVAPTCPKPAESCSAKALSFSNTRIRCDMLLLRPRRTGARGVSRSVGWTQRRHGEPQDSSRRNRVSTIGARGNLSGFG